jgi:hypothetical protein
MQTLGQPPVPCSSPSYPPPPQVPPEYRPGPSPPYPQPCALSMDCTPRVRQHVKVICFERETTNYEPQMPHFYPRVQAATPAGSPSRQIHCPSRQIHCPSRHTLTCCLTSEVQSTGILRNEGTRREISPYPTCRRRFGSVILKSAQEGRYQPRFVILAR